VTVFAEGAYAGDARIEYLRPNDERLVSYAQDADVTIRYVLDEESRSLRKTSITLGVVQLQYDLQRDHRYRIQSRSDDSRKLVLEQPREDGDWTLKDETQPAEKTDDTYRFELDLPAQKTVEFVVAEESTDQQQWNLKTIDLKTLEGLSRRKDLPDGILTTIRKVRDLRVGIDDLEAKLKVQQQLLSDIKSEQSRIRSNMSALGRDSDLYRRYVAKLTKQEDNFDKALAVIAGARVQFSQMRRELAKFFPSSSEDNATPSPFDAPDPFGNGGDNPDADPFGGADESDPFGG
jgi:hypothetical protein